MAKKNEDFHKNLKLNQYILSLFGKQTTFAALTQTMKNRDQEGLDNNGVTKFVKEIALTTNAPLNHEQLLYYDKNIVKHTKSIQGRRPQPIIWKYFQYMALLFTEIYLDKFHNNPDGLLQELNNFVNHTYYFSSDDLRKIAFWSATGSGKTLLMHINIKQYLHYASGKGERNRLNKILLVTPNEGLSKQHNQEFALSNINARFFSKQAGNLIYDEVQIIEITKLADEDGEKTVAIDAFEGNNLVLVDEGHRGASGKEWMKRRKAISQRGFTFEYSATLGQAVAGNQDLERAYKKAILFNYSYRYFYDDGFGKDFQIFNLKDDDNQNAKKTYLTACLLSFYQQKYLFVELPDDVKKFQIENPLWVFVGNKVNVVGKENGKEVSDVIDVLLFLAWFSSTQNKADVLARIAKIIAGNTGMTDEQGDDAFENIVPHIKELSAEVIYGQAMNYIFHAQHGGAFHIEQLKGADGEIALRIGNNKEFGVINVGDASKLCKLCAEHDTFVVSEKNFTGTLFHHINDADSNINILIGSKKFREGWNSWRVSVMGLMNVGRGEGSEIIQLFGRGVRLKGYQNTLKRHSHLGEYQIGHQPQLSQLERLNIFGVRANYMEHFRKQLQAEGIDTDNKRTIILPVIETPKINFKKLKTIRLKGGLNYQKDGDELPLKLHHDDNLPKVLLDYYPQMQAMSSSEIKSEHATITKKEKNLKYINLLDLNAIYFELYASKYSEEWYNLIITKDAITDILNAENWYELLMSDQQYSIFDIDLWQEIATCLLRKYIENFYRYHQNKWEAPHREYVTLDKNDKNFIHEYRITVEQSRENIINQINALKQELANNNIPTIKTLLGQSEAISFDRHLYQPLLWKPADKDDKIQIKPVALNDGEKEFVEDLQLFCENDDREIYLLRNMARGRGLGFFEAGNFYPDFILWVLAGGKQYINFIDPKGLRNISKNNPKIKFYQTIKQIEKDMGDDSIILDSFIISVTPRNELIAEYEEEDLKHILFQRDDRRTYIESIFESLD